jgi:hypothetical protein
MLRGERIAEYVTPDGEAVLVCSLCKATAEASDWTPAALAGRVAQGSSERRRRSINLRERLARVSEAAGGMLARGEPEDRPPAAPGGDSPGQPPAEARTEPEPVTPEHAMRRAIEAFNGSPEARTVRGLLRSLGEPRVAVRTGGGMAPGSVTVTVAWEISWYQWEVSGGGAVREVGKGKELSELAESDRDWNAGVGEDGRLALAPVREPERAKR